MRTSAFLVSSIVVMSAGAAQADDFASATALRGPSDVAAVAWSFTARCEQGDAFAKRQCRVVRDARQDQIARRTFLVPADDAVTVAPFDDKVMSTDLEASECISCEGVEVDGARKLLLGTGAVRKVKGKLRGAKLWAKTQTFRSKAEGRAWTQKHQQALGADLLIRVPRPLKTLDEGPAKGYRFEVVGYRVVNRCTGAVLHAEPKSGPVEADSSRCKGAAASTKPE